MFGFHNRIAKVDLSNGSIEYQELKPGHVESFIGGSGLGAAYLAEMIDGDTEPLSADNPLILMTGPFAATPVPSSTRHSFVTLSPLTGIFAESNCGGTLAYNLKRCGFDGLIISGAAKEPTMLLVEEDKVSLASAVDFWGRDAFSVDRLIQTENPAVGSTAVIGPAGEKLVRYAAVIHEGAKTRAAGRCGVGAVMGFKKLKAIAVSGQGKRQTPVAKPDELKAGLPKAIKKLKENLNVFGKVGTPGGVQNYEGLGNLPIKNWSEACAPELAAKTTGTELLERLVTGRSGCRHCPIHCGRLVNVTEGPYALTCEQEGPEYETVAGFGSLCMIDDLEAISKANELCNQLGLDTISMAGVASFAMEAVEKGIIAEAQLEGMELGFGKPAGLIELIKRVAARQGDLGRLLGEGSRLAAAALGNNAAEIAVEVKGLEFPMHDPRFSWGQSLSYATGNRGACHLTALCQVWELSCNFPEVGYDEVFPSHQREGKAQFVIHLQHLMTLADALDICKFTFLLKAASYTQLHAWFTQVSGVECSLEELLASGERIYNLKRQINVLRGISRKDDTLPPRMRTLKRRGRDYVHDVAPLNQLLSDYYEIRGWSEEGLPTKDTIERLGIGNLA